MTMLPQWETYAINETIVLWYQKNKYNTSMVITAFFKTTNGVLFSKWSLVETTENGAMFLIPLYSTMPPLWLDSGLSVYELKEVKNDDIWFVLKYFITWEMNAFCKRFSGIQPRRVKRNRCCLRTWPIDPPKNR